MTSRRGLTLSSQILLDTCDVREINEHVLNYRQQQSKNKDKDPFSEAQIVNLFDKNVDIKR